MATVIFVPILMGITYAITTAESVIAYNISHRPYTEPNDIFVKTSDTKDVEDGYFRIIVVVQKKSWERAARFSYPGYDTKTALGAQYHSSVIIQEAKAGDISGKDSLIPGIKYQMIKVKLEPGKDYEVSYGKAGALGLWTFPKNSMLIKAADHVNVNRRTHYVYFDEDGYFAKDPNHFYTAKQLFK